MDINLLDDASYYENQPHEQFDWLRENEPVYWYKYGDDEKHEGVWLLTRYKEIFEVNRDYERFTSSGGVLYPHTNANPQDVPEEEVTPGFKPMMLYMDPPEHSDHRKLLSRTLTPNAVLEYEPRIRAIAKQIVDEVIDKGRCEFVSDVAGEMAGRVTADLLGLPLEDSPQLYKFTEIFHSPSGYLSEKVAEERLEQMREYIKDAITSKKEQPGNDLISKLIQGEVDGNPLIYDTIFENFVLLVNGGTDTARNVIALGLYEMLRNKEQLDWLMQDLQARIPRAREELLRWISPVIYQCRTARHDTVLNGREIKKGQMLALYFGAANRDPAKFENPHTLDLSREENKHIAFGGGHHICLGQWLAKTEIDALLTEVLTRLHNIKVMDPPEWLGSNFIFGLRELNIRFDT